MFLLSTKPLQSAQRFTRKRCPWTVYIPFEFNWLWTDLSIEVAGRSDRETRKTVHIININLINDRYYYYFTDHIKFSEKIQAHLQSCVTCNKLYSYKHVFKKHSHFISGITHWAWYISRHMKWKLRFHETINDGLIWYKILTTNWNLTGVPTFWLKVIAKYTATLYQ